MSVGVFVLISSSALWLMVVCKKTKGRTKEVQSRSARYTPRTPRRPPSDRKNHRQSSVSNSKEGSTPARSPDGGGGSDPLGSATSTPKETTAVNGEFSEKKKKMKTSKRGGLMKTIRRSIRRKQNKKLEKKSSNEKNKNKSVATLEDTVDTMMTEEKETQEAVRTQSVTQSVKVKNKKRKKRDGRTKTEEFMESLNDDDTLRCVKSIGH